MCTYIQWVDATDGYGGFDFQDRLARLHAPHYSVLEEVGPGGSDGSEAQGRHSQGLELSLEIDIIYIYFYNRYSRADSHVASSYVHTHIFIYVYI